MGMPFCGGRKWNQLAEKGAGECGGRTLNKRADTERDRDRQTQSNKAKKQKYTMQGRDGKSTACATKMTCDRKCHRERGRKSNQATRSQRTRETGKQGQTHLQAPRFLEARAASAFSGGQ